jgi:hypothetical protein
MQPIEMFWGIGKDWAGELCLGKRSMKDTVAHLREGWYGNEYLFRDEEGEDAEYLYGDSRRPRKR